MNLSIKQAVHIMERDGHLGLNHRLVRLFMRLMGDYLIRTSLRMRSRDLTNAVILQRLIHVLGMLCWPMHQSKSRRMINGEKLVGVELRWRALHSGTREQLAGQQ